MRKRALWLLCAVVLATSAVAGLRVGTPHVGRGGIGGGLSGVSPGLADTPGGTAVYVDSAAADDSGDGLSEATAEKTLAAAATTAATATALPVTIYLKRGSYWREMLKPTTAANIATYGSGTPPTMDGADVISPGAFTASAHADAGGVTYELSLTRDPAGVYVSGDTYMIWENGAWLQRRASVALVAANPGSFYLPSPNAAVSASLAYVHPFGSTNPTSDGKTYEYSKRSSGIEMAHLDDCTVTGPIHVKRGNGAYGSFTAGRNFTVSRVMSSYGGKHNFVAASGTYTDCIAYDAETGRSILTDGGLIPWTFYRPNTVGLSYTVNRCMTIFPTGRINTGSQALYSHNSSGALYDSGNINGFISLRGGTISPFVLSTAINDAVVLDFTGTAISMSAVANPVSVSRAIIRSPSPITGGVINYPSSGGVAGLTAEIADTSIYVAAGNSSSGQTISISLAGVVNVHHNIMALAGNAGSILFAAGAAGSQSKNNIIIDTRTVSGNAWWQGTSNAAVENNVYAQGTGYSGTRIWWQTPGAGTAANLTERRSETGHDLNSVLLTATQTDTMLLNASTDLANGDFRLEPTSGGNLVDGTSIYGNVGPRSHYNWNTRALVDGAPSKFPTPPATEAECISYITDPTAWNFYP